MPFANLFEKLDLLALVELLHIHRQGYIPPKGLVFDSSIVAQAWFFCGAHLQDPCVQPTMPALLNATLQYLQPFPWAWDTPFWAETWWACPTSSCKDFCTCWSFGALSRSFQCSPSSPWAHLVTNKKPANEWLNQKGIVTIPGDGSASSPLPCSRMTNQAIQIKDM